MSCWTAHDEQLLARRSPPDAVGEKLEPPETMCVWPATLPGDTIGSARSIVMGLKHVKRKKPWTCEESRRATNTVDFMSCYRKSD